MAFRSAGRRWGLVVSALAGAVVLAAAAQAFACTVEATIDLNKATGIPGATVNGTGKNFVSLTDDPTAKPVQVRFNSLDGAVLWSGRPDLNGAISFSFPVPKVSAGDYTVVATLYSPRSGRTFTARAPFRVNAPEASTTPAPAPALPLPSGSRDQGGGQGASPGRGDVTRPAPARSRAEGTRPRSTPASGQARPSSSGNGAASAATQRGGSAAANRSAQAGGAQSQSSATPRNAGTQRPAAQAGRDRPAAQAAPGQQREAMIAPGGGASGSSGSPLLALILLGTGLLVSVVAAALVVADRKAEKPLLARLRKGPRG